MPSREQLMQVIQIQTELAKLGLDLGGVMQFIVEQTLDLLEADGAVIELAEEGEMVYRAASGIARGQLGLRLIVDGSLSGLCVHTGEPQTCDDSETDGRVDRDACRKVGLRSMIVLPLKHRGESVGVIKAISSQPAKFLPRDITLLGMLTEMVAASMFFSAKYDSDDLFIKATHDEMTGLANRALFMDRLRNIVSLDMRHNTLSGLLMIDMDGLKKVNDQYGHRTGDAVLIEFARRLKEVTRKTDTAARMGGDEFAVLITPLDDPSGIDSLISRLEEINETPLEFEGQRFLLKASIGYVLIPQEGTDPDMLLDKADRRMYAEKRARKDRRKSQPESQVKTLH